MSNVQFEVRRLLQETLRIQKEAEEILDGLLQEFRKNLPNEREKALRREAVIRKRLYAEELQEKCWSNINQCYQLLQRGVVTSEMPHPQTITLHSWHPCDS